MKYFFSSPECYFCIGESISENINQSPRYLMYSFQNQFVFGLSCEKHIMKDLKHLANYDGVADIKEITEDQYKTYLLLR